MGFLRVMVGLAHDFNNMLGVILGNAGLALAGDEARVPIHSSLEEIRRAAERSADLTRQLLAFARKRTVAPRVLGLNENVDRTLSMLRRLLGEDIDLVWTPQPDLWPVQLDPHPGLKRILMSGHAASVIADHGLLEAGVHFIQKPFSLNDLATKVREALGRPGGRNRRTRIHARGGHRPVRGPAGTALDIPIHLFNIY